MRPSHASPAVPVVDVVVSALEHPVAALPVLVATAVLLWAVWEAAWEVVWAAAWAEAPAAKSTSPTFVRSLLDH